MSGSRGRRRSGVEGVSGGEADVEGCAGHGERFEHLELWRDGDHRNCHACDDEVESVEELFSCEIA